MGGSVNRVFLIGNLGADPEIRDLSRGQKIAGLRVATSVSWIDKATGEKLERTEWHNVSVIAPFAVDYAAAHLKKGSKVFVEGMLQTRRWQDQADGHHYSTDVVVNADVGQLIGLTTKLEEIPKNQTRAGQSTKTDFSDFSGCDFPF